MFCVCQGLRVIIKAFSDLNRSNSFNTAWWIPYMYFQNVWVFFFLKLKVQLISYDELSPIKLIEKNYQIVPKLLTSIYLYLPHIFGLRIIILQRKNQQFRDRKIKFNMYNVHNRGLISIENICLIFLHFISFLCKCFPLSMFIAKMWKKYSVYTQNNERYSQPVAI